MNAPVTRRDALRSIGSGAVFAAVMPVVAAEASEGGYMSAESIQREIDRIRNLPDSPMHAVYEALQDVADRLERIIERNL